MQPTVSDVHVNTPLTQISIAYMQDQSNFVSTRIFPSISVSKQSDCYFVYDRGSFNRDEMRIRAPATESVGSGWNVDATPTYYAPRYSFHHDIPDEVRANADAQLAPDREASIYVTMKALIKREKLWVSKFFTGGVWGSQLTGVSGTPGTNEIKQWNDAASTPIQDVRRIKRVMAENTGFEPNKLVLGRAVYDALLDHPDIIDRIKYGQTPNGPAVAGRSTLAALLEMDEIVVMNAIENVTKEGQVPVHHFIGGNHALFAYAAPSPGLMTPSAGYTFGWTGLIGAGPEGQRIRQFRMELIGSDRVEIDMCFDQKLVGADLGAFLYNLVA
jgi:hypothetical protein